MKEDKPIKQRYYPKNPKIQGDITAIVDELLQMGFIEHSAHTAQQLEAVGRLQTDQREVCKKPTRYPALTTSWTN